MKMAPRHILSVNADAVADADVQREQSLISTNNFLDESIVQI